MVPLERVRKASQTKGFDFCVDSLRSRVDGLKSDTWSCNKLIAGSDAHGSGKRRETISLLVDSFNRIIGKKNNRAAFEGPRAPVTLRGRSRRSYSRHHSELAFGERIRSWKMTGSGTAPLICQL